MHGPIAIIIEQKKDDKTSETQIGHFGLIRSPTSHQSEILLLDILDVQVKTEILSKENIH